MKPNYNYNPNGHNMNVDFDTEMSLSNQMRNVIPIPEYAPFTQSAQNSKTSLPSNPSFRTLSLGPGRSSPTIPQPQPQSQAQPAQWQSQSQSQSYNYKVDNNSFVLTEYQDIEKQRKKQKQMDEMEYLKKLVGFVPKAKPHSQQQQIWWTLQHDTSAISSWNNDNQSSLSISTLLEKKNSALSFCENYYAQQHHQNLNSTINSLLFGGDKDNKDHKDATTLSRDSREKVLLQPPTSSTNSNNVNDVMNISGVSSISYAAPAPFIQGQNQYQHWYSPIIEDDVAYPEEPTPYGDAGKTGGFGLGMDNGNDGSFNEPILGLNFAPSNFQAGEKENIGVPQKDNVPTVSTTTVRARKLSGVQPVTVAGGNIDNLPDGFSEGVPLRPMPLVFNPASRTTQNKRSMAERQFEKIRSQKLQNEHVSVWVAPWSQGQHYAVHQQSQQINMQSHGNNTRGTKRIEVNIPKIQLWQPQQQPFIKVNGIPTVGNSKATSSSHSPQQMIAVAAASPTQSQSSKNSKKSTKKKKKVKNSWASKQSQSDWRRSSGGQHAQNQQQQWQTKHAFLRRSSSSVGSYRSKNINNNTQTKQRNSTSSQIGQQRNSNGVQFAMSPIRKGQQKRKNNSNSRRGTTTLGSSITSLKSPTNSPYLEPAVLGVKQMKKSQSAGNLNSNYNQRRNQLGPSQSRQYYQQHQRNSSGSKSQLHQTQAKIRAQLSEKFRQQRQQAQQHSTNEFKYQEQDVDHDFNWDQSPCDLPFGLQKTIDYLTKDVLLQSPSPANESQTQWSLSQSQTDRQQKKPSKRKNSKQKAGMKKVVWVQQKNRQKLGDENMRLLEDDPLEYMKKMNLGQQSQNQQQMHQFGDDDDRQGQQMECNSPTLSLDINMDQFQQDLANGPWGFDILQDLNETNDEIVIQSQNWMQVQPQTKFDDIIERQKRRQLWNWQQSWNTNTTTQLQSNMQAPDQDYDDIDKLNYRKMLEQMKQEEELLQNQRRGNDRSQQSNVITTVYEEDSPALPNPASSILIQQQQQSLSQRKQHQKKQASPLLKPLDESTCVVKDEDSDLQDGEEVVISIRDKSPQKLKQMKPKPSPSQKILDDLIVFEDDEVAQAAERENQQKQESEMKLSVRQQWEKHQEQENQSQVTKKQEPKLSMTEQLKQDYLASMQELKRGYESNLQMLSSNQTQKQQQQPDFPSEPQQTKSKRPKSALSKNAKKRQNQLHQTYPAAENEPDVGTNSSSSASDDNNSESEQDSEEREADEYRKVCLQRVKEQSLKKRQEQRQLEKEKKEEKRQRKLSWQRKREEHSVSVSVNDSYDQSNNKGARSRSNSYSKSNMMPCQKKQIWENSVSFQEQQHIQEGWGQQTLQRQAGLGVGLRGAGTRVNVNNLNIKASPYSSAAAKNLERLRSLKKRVQVLPATSKKQQTMKPISQSEAYNDENQQDDDSPLFAKTKYKKQQMEELQDNIVADDIQIMKSSVSVLKTAGDFDLDVDVDHDKDDFISQIPSPLRNKGNRRGQGRSGTSNIQKQQFVQAGPQQRHDEDVVLQFYDDEVDGESPIYPSQNQKHFRNANTNNFHPKKANVKIHQVPLKAANVRQHINNSLRNSQDRKQQQHQSQQKPNIRKAHTQKSQVQTWSSPNNQNQLASKSNTKSSTIQAQAQQQQQHTYEISEILNRNQQLMSQNHAGGGAGMVGSLTSSMDLTNRSNILSGVLIGNKPNANTHNNNINNDLQNESHYDPVLDDSLFLQLGNLDQAFPNSNNYNNANQQLQGHQETEELEKLIENTRELLVNRGLVGNNNNDDSGCQSQNGAIISKQLDIVSQDIDQLNLEAAQMLNPHAMGTTNPNSSNANGGKGSGKHAHQQQQHQSPAVGDYLYDIDKALADL